MTDTMSPGEAVAKLLAPANTYDLLEKIVNETKCKPGWSFSLIDEDGAKRLYIQIRGYHNYDHTKSFNVNHVHPVPVTTYNEKSWRRWIFDRCIATMNHEIGESLRFGAGEEDPPGSGGVRPFVPMHGPGEDPYTVHEWRPETDARTTQDGSLRKGPI